MLDIYIDSGPPGIISYSHRRLSKIALSGAVVDNDLKQSLRNMLFKLATLQGVSQADVKVLNKIERLYSSTEETQHEAANR